VSVTVSPVKNCSGTQVGASTIVRDVTEETRDRAELAQQAGQLLTSAEELVTALARAEQSEATYRELLDQLPDTATFVYGTDRRLSSVSGSSFMAGSVDLAQAAGKTVDEVYESASAAMMHGYLDDAFAGATVDTEVEVEVAERVCHVHAALLPPQKGDVSAKVMVLIRDISASKKRENLLSQSEERWRVAFESAPVGIAELDSGGKVVAANRAIGALLEIPSDELVGTRIISYSHPDDLANAEQRVLDVAANGTTEIVERHMITALGNHRWVSVQGLLVAGLGVKPDRVLAYWVNGTAEHIARERLAETGARFAALVERSADAIVVQDVVGGRVDYASPGLFAMLGLTAEAAVGSDLEHLIHPDDLAKAHERSSTLSAGMGTSVSFDGRMRHTDGTWRDVETTTTNLIADPAVRGVISNLHDVTDRVEAAKLLAHQAMHDTLTELPNRALLLDRLDQALARAARSGRPCALLFIDLDHFKQVNDNLGHPAGDELLKAVAARLLQTIRPGDSVGRLGGDEFVVLAENIDEPATVFAIAERVRACIAEPVTVADKAVTVSGTLRGPPLGWTCPGRPRCRRPYCRKPR
jgi:diguanylate cyclase (GGDEF)-like protein/PAS domain S-box-containing protein